ncbi:cellulose biosynthesis cyclic di-GMP-binding regulatory protein BcsB [Rhizobium rhizophilum]|nr:cellulose biosynthesis cyclic di-GMP-binding regulatory protein BcsB [Rhizobium rhizophilum]
MRKRNLTVLFSTATILLLAAPNLSTVANDLTPATTSTSATTPMSRGQSQLVSFRQSGSEMRLEGEDAVRELTFYLSPDQAATGGALRLSYTNAVSVLPDDGTVDVELNGKPLSSFPIRSPHGPTTHDLPVAANDLVAGWNSVRIRARQHHRIDCSIDATYELWSQFDPLVSGFVALVAAKDGDLASLLSVGRNGDAATEIRLIAKPETARLALRDSLALMQTLALILGRNDIVVTVGELEGTGPGIDLHVGDLDNAELPQASQDALAGAPRGLSVRRNDAGRYAVTMRASGQAETQALLLAAVNGPLQPLIRANKLAASRSIVDGSEPGTHELSGVGYKTSPFSGRLFQTSFDVVMPADFYPGDYATVDLHLNAATAPGLAAGTQILVRVNERAAASQMLHDPEGVRLEDKPLELPLRAFHPGVNHVRILAELPTASDLACDPAARDESRSRFLMLQETTVTIPPLARAGRLPDLAAFAGKSFPFAGSGAFDIYVDAPTPARLGSALTVLARMAISAGHPLPVELKIGRPDPAKTTGNILVVNADGGAAQSAALTVPKGHRLHMPATDELVTASIGDTGPSSDSEALLNAFQVETKLDEEKLSAKRRITAWLSAAATTVNRWLTYREIGDDVHIEMQDRLISVRQSQVPEGDAVWTVVSAADETSLSLGVAALTRPGTWTALEGEESVIRRSDLELVNRKPQAYSFFPITDTSPANLRRLAAAWLSDNFLVYVALVVLLMGGFGWWVGYMVPRKGVRTVE